MSKISKSIVISEFLWLLFFAVVFLKFDCCFVDLDHSNCYYQLLSYTIVFGGLFNYRVFCQHFCIFSCQD